MGQNIATRSPDPPDEPASWPQSLVREGRVRPARQGGRHERIEEASPRKPLQWRPTLGPGSRPVLG
eukprot:15442701-Alexandrium_andersonii.AAC.1